MIVSLLVCFTGLRLDGDDDDGTCTTKGIAGVGIDVMEHSRAFVATCRQIHRELCSFDLTTNGDSTGLVDDLAGVVADDLNDLGVAVDGLVDDHEVSFGGAVGEVGRGVHADVDHAFLDLLVQAGNDAIGICLIPAAFHSTGVVDDACC